MSYTTGCCCEKISCGYLIVTGRKYGVDPVYGDSGVDFWIRSFSGYVDDPATKRCNASADLPYGGITADLEIWQSAKPVTSFPPRDYVWSGSPYSDMRDFHYNIRGRIILPTKYKGIPIKDSVSVQADDGEVKPHYRLYTGDVVDPGADILETLNLAFSRNTNPYIVSGLVVAYAPGSSICSETQNLQQVNLKGITTENNTSLSKIDRNFWNIEVEYTDVINTAINSKKPFQLFFTVIPPPVATGDYNSLCPAYPPFTTENEYWCKGATFDNLPGRQQGDLCTSVPPKLINDKTMKLGYFQSIPEKYYLYRVDIFLCKDETGTSYLTLGDFNYNDTFYVTPIISNSLNKCDTCKKEQTEWENRDNPKPGDVNPRDLQRANYTPRVCGSLSDEQYPPFLFGPVQGTGIGIAWSDQCTKFPLTREACGTCENHNCQLTLYWRANWEQVSTTSTYTPLFNPNNCAPALCSKYRSYGYQNVGWEVSTTPISPCSEEPVSRTTRTPYYSFCEKDNTTVQTLEVVETVTSYCVSGSSTISVCGGSSQEVFSTNIHILSETTEYGPCGQLGIGQSRTTTHSDRYVPLSFKLEYPSVCVDNPYGTGQSCRGSYLDCICCCNNCGNSPTSISQYFLLGARKEITKYIINPFIFQTGTHLDKNGLPDFTAFIKNGYLPAWKGYMSEYVSKDANFYDVFVPNPSCPKPQSGDSDSYFSALPGSYFFYNPNIPTTEGKKLTPYTNPQYIGCVGPGSYSLEYKYEILPNPVKPLSRMYGSDSGITNKIYCRKPFRPSATSVYIHQDSLNTGAWQNVKKYFGYHVEYANGITYDALDVDITKCTTFMSESFLRTWIFDPKVP